MLSRIKERISNEKENLQKQIAFLEEVEQALNMIEDIQKKAPDMYGLARLIDRVDQIGKDVDMMKLRRGEPLAAPTPSVVATPIAASPVIVESVEAHELRKGRKRGPKSRLDEHARLLIKMLSNAPGVYTVDDIMDMMSVGKPAAIKIIRRAVDLDPEHMKITTGSRKKIFVHYYLEGVRGKEESHIDHVKLELMEMAAGVR